jgi:hypothetical protein
VVATPENKRFANRAALVSLVCALLALLVGSFDRFGAVLGLAAIAFGIWGVLLGEKTETGIPASLFGIVLGLVAVFWAAASFASK